MATFFYKYRDTSNIVRLLDILIRNRLYACTNDKLNDPMEGKFLYSGGSKDYKKRIKEKLDKMLICSLSTTCDNGLLWTHYAKQHTGCCIEVEITAESWKQENIKYLTNIPNIDETGFQNDDDAVDAILFQKSIDWSYEHETRCIKKKEDNTKPYLAIRVKRILLGIRMDRAEKAFIKDFVKVLNKGRKESDRIIIHQMTKNEINFSYII